MGHICGAVCFGDMRERDDDDKWGVPAYGDYVVEATATKLFAQPVKVDNSNELLKRYPECVGMKTGYTQAAGRCLVGAATRGNKTVIAVLLGSTEEAILAMGLAAIEGLDNAGDPITVARGNRP